jgi:hypothetical protein
MDKLLKWYIFGNITYNNKYTLFIVSSPFLMHMPTTLEQRKGATQENFYGKS